MPLQDIEPTMEKTSDPEDGREAAYLRLQRRHSHLEKACAHYADFFHNAPVAYLVLDVHGRVKEVNSAALRLLGVDRKHLLGHPLSEFIHSQGRTAFSLFLEALKEPDALQNCEVALRRPGEREVHTCIEAVAGKPAQSPDSILRLALHDISEHHRTEELILAANQTLQDRVDRQTEDLHHINQALEQKIEETRRINQALLAREAKLNSILNAATDGIITIDPSGTIESANTAAESIFGYSEYALIGCPIGSLIPEFHQFILDQAADRFPSRPYFPASGLHRETMGTRRDASTIPLEVSISQFRIGKKSYNTCIVRDITERKQKQQQDRERLDQLAHASRLSMMGEMASGLAHELNQPLTAVASYLQAAKRVLVAHSSHSDMPEMLQRAIDNAETQALMAGRIIHRMRDFATAHKMHRSTLDINAIVAEALSLCSIALKQNSIKKKLDLAPRLPETYGDTVYIEQVLLNLFRNGIEAMSELPDHEERLLTVQTVRSGAEIQVFVRDQGPGITEEEAKQMFAPFHSTKDSGMGLGLTISRSIIEAHGGRLWFEFGPGNGAAFGFSLPIAGDP